MPAGTLPAGRFAAPEIIAGTYRKPAEAAPSNGGKPWLDDLKSRVKDGN